MQSVAKWGNSLGVRLPAELVKAMGLKAGSKVRLVQDGEDSVTVKPAMTKEEALAEMANARWQLPPGWKFDRNEIYDRND